MSDFIVNKTLTQQKLNFDKLLQQLQDFATAIDNQKLQITIDNLRQNINEPFLFVVVGEVKAGKSSFINALLKANICRTAAEPCTDIIQQIVYSTDKFKRSVNQHLQKVGLPIGILQNLSIVDTPGTNTIVEHHQEITKQFIPNSDLIFFVFFAKNPYTHSAWELLDYVNVEWRKKVVFILQQADLTKPEELTKNQEKLTELARQRGINNPTIFATSVEYEIQKRQDNSGFTEVRNYIEHTLAKKGSIKLKLQGIATTSQKIINLLTKDINALQQQLQQDRAIVTDIKNKLQRNKQRSQYELDSLTVRLLTKYDKIVNPVKAEFREKLSIVTLIKSSFAVLFGTDKVVPLWMDRLKQSCEVELKSSLGEISQDGIKHFVEGVRQLLQDLVGDLQHIQINRINNSLISLKTVERRQDVIEDVQTRVSSLMSDRNFLHTIESINASVAPTFLGGSAATLAGGAIAAITEIVLLDIIGTAFAGVGLMVAGGTLVLKKRKMIERFETKLDREKLRFERELSNKLTYQLDLIYEEIERNFIDIYDCVATQEANLLPLAHKFEEIKKQAKKSFDAIERN